MVLIAALAIGYLYAKNEDEVNSKIKMALKSFKQLLDSLQ